MKKRLNIRHAIIMMVIVMTIAVTSIAMATDPAPETTTQAVSARELFLNNLETYTNKPDFAASCSIQLIIRITKSAA